METTAFQRFEAALGKKAPWLKHDEANGIDIKSLMKDRKAFKARQQKHENDLNAWVGELTAEVANLEKSVSPQAVAVIDAFVWGAGGKREKIKDASAQMTVRSLFLRAEHLRNAQAAAPAAKPTAPPVVPATASSAAPSKPATPMQLTPEIKAKGAAALAAITNPETRGAAVSGLQQAIEANKRVMLSAEFLKLPHDARNSFMRGGGKLTTVAAQANTTADQVHKMPNATTINSEETAGEVDFSFCPLSHKRTLQAEFDENRGLTPDSWILWMRARQEYFNRVGAIPEGLTGGKAVIPAVVLETRTDAEKRLRAWAQGDKYFTDKIASLEAELAKVNTRDPKLSGHTWHDIERLERGIASTKEMAAKQKAKREEQHAAELKKTQERFEALRKVLF